MQLKTFKLIRDTSIRFDPRIIMQIALSLNSTNAVPLHAICHAKELDRVSKPNNAFYYCEIGSVDMFGMGEPFWLDEDKIEPGSEVGAL